jgi:hypothetical protein
MSWRSIGGLWLDWIISKYIQFGVGCDYNAASLGRKIWQLDTHGS